MPDELQASTSADLATDFAVAGPPTDLAPPTSQRTGEYDCLRCGWTWDRHRHAPRPPASYHPRACPNCHSAYWDKPPKQAHAGRPAVNIAIDHVRRQADQTLSRQRSQLRRILFALGADAAWEVIRQHVPFADFLRPPEAMPILLAAPEPSSTGASSLVAQQPIQLHITVQSADAPRYPWQLAPQDSVSTVAALIPPPPSLREGQ